MSFDRLITLNNTELMCLVEQDNILGFIYSIILDDMIFILYLAVNGNYRSKGCGSYILNSYLEKYKEKQIYLNIEEVREEYNDYEIRLKRLKFYLKNGFYKLDYISCEEEQNFNILSNSQNFDINKYKELDKYVNVLLNESSSKILKIEN